jgi:PHD/YefM family antitoxin component YafN of YafNO toxin-antitoxin module
LSGSHGVTDGNNKYVALLIAVLALFLAFSEMLGKNAEKASMQANIEANNLWAFFQAKTIRRSLAQNLVEFAEMDTVGVTDEARKAAVTKQVATWRALAARLESEPDTNEGRRELMRRAQDAEKKRDRENQKNEGFEVASAILQVSIVVASAMIITGVALLGYLAGGLGILALGIMSLAQFAPHLLPFH